MVKRKRVLQLSLTISSTIMDYHRPSDKSLTVWISAFLLFMHCTLVSAVLIKSLKPASVFHLFLAAICRWLLFFSNFTIDFNGFHLKQLIVLWCNSFIQFILGTKCKSKILYPANSWKASRGSWRVKTSAWITQVTLKRINRKRYWGLGLYYGVFFLVWSQITVWSLKRRRHLCIVHA